MRFWNVTWTTLVVCLIEPFAMRCGAQATLSWNPSISTNVASYNVCWGTNSHNYIYTNNYPNTTTNVTISGLTTNEVFYFAVQSVASNGLISDFSNETDYTNGPPTNFPGGPPPPPGGPPLGGGGSGGAGNPGGGSPGGGSPGGGSPGGGSPGGGSPGGGSPPTTNSPSSGLTQSSAFWGVPPLLGLAVSNGQVNLNIGGTVGALLNIMGTTNDMSLNEWSTLTNVTLTNIAIMETNQQGPQDVLDVAFVPAAQTVQLPTNGAPFQYFQVVMPYDYVILADQVLLGNSNYTPRLIVVNMPGVVDDACYVNQVNSFIHYARTNSALQLFSSGNTIRNIANALASWLNLDWTTASEFTYSNGMGQILATVIETDPPSSDPVAGQGPAGPPIVIDF